MAERQDKIWDWRLDKGRCADPEHQEFEWNGGDARNVISLLNGSAVQQAVGVVSESGYFVSWKNSRDNRAKRPKKIEL